jgi:hypothetical protein
VTHSGPQDTVALSSPSNGDRGSGGTKNKIKN